MELIFSVLTCGYGFLTFLLFRGWEKIPAFKEAGGLQRSLFLSVVIPVRNESANIAGLLGDVSRQVYAPANFEVIVVDDNSTDDTLEKVRAFQRGSALDVKLIKRENEPVGKKSALTAGINIARGEVIVTTDGDCRVHTGWLSSLNAFFVRKDLVMATGPVTFNGERSLFEQLQTIEFASLTGTGAASLYYNRPNMCNGANLAFKKEAFAAVDGYAGSWHIPSGDDEFLMHKMAAKYPGKVYFLKCQDAIVTTKACRNISGFIHQRKRWAGKWKLHKKVSVKILAIFIFLYHATFIIALFSAIYGSFNPGLFLCLAVIKILPELVFLRAVLKFMKKRLRPFYFLLLQIVYPWYVVFFGLTSNRGRYEWKGRKIFRSKAVLPG